MVDIKYKMNWVPQAKELRDSLTKKQNKSIASKTDEDTDDDFYQNIFESLSKYFSSDEEAAKVLIPEETDRDGISSSVLKSYADVMKPYGLTGMLSREAVDVEVDKILGDSKLLEIPTKTFDDTEEETTDGEDTDSSTDDDTVGEAQDNQPNLDDAPTGGLGSPIREPGFSPIEEAIKEKTSKFYLDIGIHAESDHGDIPKPTNDAREKDKPKPVDNFNPKTSEKSLDIAYGHKITQEEHETGLIHGIKFKEESGYKEGRERFVLLTDEQKRFILEKDMEQNLKNARSGPDGWDAKLNKFGGTWDELDYKYKNALTSLAYNVRKPKQWNLVLKAAMDEDVKEFAKELRRKDAGEITKGMDNRVAKELYYSGIIENFSDVSDVLTKTNAKNVGMPK